MATSRIRIVMKSYDHNLLDKSTEKLVKTIKETGAVLSGPIPMPTKRKVYTVLRSPHVNKKAREQFEIRVHKRLIDIYANSSRTVEELMKLDLPSGVDISVKV